MNSKELSKRRGNLVIARHADDFLYIIEVMKVLQQNAVVLVSTNIPDIYVADRNELDIYAVSEHFDEIKEGEVIPRYELFITGKPGKLKFDKFERNEQA